MITILLKEMTDERVEVVVLCEVRNEQSLEVRVQIPHNPERRGQVGGVYCAIITGDVVCQWGKQRRAVEEKSHDQI